MIVLSGGFSYEGENNNAQASASNGNMPVDKTSNLLDSEDRKHVNDSNANKANDGNISSDNIDYIIIRLRIEELKL